MTGLPHGHNWRVGACSADCLTVLLRSKRLLGGKDTGKPGANSSSWFRWSVWLVWCLAPCVVICLCFLASVHCKRFVVTHCCFHRLTCSWWRAHCSSLCQTVSESLSLLMFALDNALCLLQHVWPFVLGFQVPRLYKEGPWEEGSRMFVSGDTHP